LQPKSGQLHRPAAVFLEAPGEVLEMERRKSKSTEPPTPEQVFSIIESTPEGMWHQRLFELLLTVPNPIGRRIMDIIDCHIQTTERLEAEVERHINRKPDDAGADQILILKQNLSWTQLARHLSEKEGREVSVDSAKQRYYRARARKGRIGAYAVTPRRGTV
jgi:hypothetical protein